MSEVIKNQRANGTAYLTADLAREQEPIKAQHRGGQFVPQLVRVTVGVTGDGVGVSDVRLSGPIVLKGGTLSDKQTGSAEYSYAAARGKTPAQLGISRWSKTDLPGPDVLAAVEELFAAWVKGMRYALEATESRSENYMTEADEQSWGRL